MNISYPAALTFVEGALIEFVLLSTHKICFRLTDKNLAFKYRSEMGQPMR